MLSSAALTSTCILSAVADGIDVFFMLEMISCIVSARALSSIGVLLPLSFERGADTSASCTLTASWLPSAFFRSPFSLLRCFLKEEAEGLWMSYVSPDINSSERKIMYGTYLCRHEGMRVEARRILIV